MIEINNLTKMYGKQCIFKNVNFTLPTNGLVCLLGASGCGKSTLLNILAGFDSDYSGSIKVLGTEINKMSSQQLCNYRRDNIGFVFQNYNLLPGYTVRENILLACNGDNDTDNRLNILLKQFDMLSKLNEKVENLSGGQKQRAAILRALMGDPTIILADEPTGALDRKNSTEIMMLLKKMSEERLVLVITHDKKICEFADSVISIQDNQIIESNSVTLNYTEQSLKFNKNLNKSMFANGFKNFKVHIKRYVAISLAISIGILAFMLSLSIGNVTNKSITDFKEKNTAFNNGYVKVADNADKVLKFLQKDPRIGNVYNQYIINNITLKIGEKSESISEKYPMPKATESMSYGVMPKMGQKQIAFSPSLAKKFDNNINKLIGKKINLKLGSDEYTLTISGIFNAGYDDFFVSSDIEKKFYKSMGGKTVYSISYDVNNFKDIVSVTKMLKEEKIESKTAAKEVDALQTTFQNISRLFFIVSLLILIIGLLISIILLAKLQNSRYREIGLLSALGFSKKNIKTIIIFENLLLSLTAIVFNCVFITAAYLISSILKLGLIITMQQTILSIISTGIVVVLISMAASYKLIHTEPAEALRK